MSATELETNAWRNVRSFMFFRMFFSARFYYPIYALLFLDYGLTLGQFALLNGIWAATIVLLEVPSGALADTIGRRKLLIFGAVCMCLEMIVLLWAPIGGGALLFLFFVVNRLLSGVAEAAASGADEALTYDSLKAAGLEGEWGRVLERVQRATSIAFFFAMMIGAAVYDARLVNGLLGFLGFGWEVEGGQLVKMPIALTFLSALVVLAMAFRMREAPGLEKASLMATLAKSWRQTLAAAGWIWVSPLPFAIILAAMAIDSVVRQFLTLASEYWRVIELPIASFGLIGSGMALMGLFVPTVARILTEKNRPVTNFLLTAATVLIGLIGLGMAIPYWGIVPAALLYASIQLTGYFVSRYLNESAPSEQRATILSFRSLCTNFSYGGVSILYSGLIIWLQQKAVLNEIGSPDGDAIFVSSLQTFAWFFLFAVVCVCLIHRLRFRDVAGRLGIQ